MEEIMTHEVNALPAFKAMGATITEPEKTALVFVSKDGSHENVSYEDIFTNVNRLSHALIRSGIGKGDRFAVVMRNHPEFIYSLFAALSVGAVIVPVDPRSKGRKLAFQINNTRSKGIILEDDFLGNYEQVKSEIKDTAVIGVSYKSHHGVLVSPDYPVLSELLDSASTSPVDGNEAPDLNAPAQIIHTSGTTGDPKGVVLKGDRFFIYGMMADFLWQYTPDDILYTGLSMTHGNAQSVTIIPALAKGIKAVISEQFTKSSIWDICRQYNCTSFSLLGGMMAGIYNETPKGTDKDNPVRKVISAGTPRAIWTDFETRFDTRIHEWYAAVEGGLAHNPPGFGPVGSFGKPPEGIMEIRVVDEQDNDLAPNEKGELISRMVSGKTEVNYLGKEKASEDKTRGGWLRSGDICHRDEEGFLFFDFRKGGGLRRQGDFVQPDLVEKIIGSDPTVSEVCVYGIAASSGAPGESDLVAALAPCHGHDIAIDDIKGMCRKELERNCQPSYFQLVDAIPKTISEKPLERVLRDQFDPNGANVILF
ncbi:MAG: AMP-binding protein [Desulfobacterium sp.]|nr:AMP-binding protein [Desulfobacterium sp.]